MKNIFKGYLWKVVCSAVAVLIFTIFLEKIVLQFYQKPYNIFSDQVILSLKKYQGNYSQIADED